MIVTFTLLSALSAMSGMFALDEAEARLASLHYEEAAALFAAAAADTSLDHTTRALAWLGLGRVQAGMGDLETAERSFEQAVALDRNVSLPRGTSPKLQALLDDVRAKAPVRAPAQPANQAPSIIALSAGALGIVAVGGVAAALGTEAWLNDIPATSSRGDVTSMREFGVVGLAIGAAAGITSVALGVAAFVVE